jgi:hypothetical protein
VFEFADIDYISLAFSIKGILDIVIANAFPFIGVYIYELMGDFQNACLFWFIFSLGISLIFYLCFFVWKYSDNT